MDRCPACRARLEGLATCPRCGCELTLVLRAEAQAEAHTRLALASWIAGASEVAAQHARTARKLVAASPLQEALGRWLGL